MVERHAVRRVRHHGPRPGLLGAAFDLGEPGCDVARADEDHAAESIRIGAAVVLHPAVVRPVHRALERHVVAGGPGAEPARRQCQIDIDAFVIQILDALRGLVIAAHRRLALAFRAGESRHVAALVGFRLRSAELAQILARAFRIDGEALALRAEWLPRREPLFLRAREVALEHVHVRTDVRVGIENAVAVSRHAAF